MEFKLGKIKQNTSITTRLAYTGDKTISRVEPSCGCMDVYYKDKFINLTFRAGMIPHIAIVNQGYQDIYKYVTIYYKDNTSERVNVTGQIIP